MKGYAALLQLLLGTGKVDVDTKDAYSRTPLLRVDAKGQEAVVQILRQ
jgi:ankyrin repeat protein